MDNKNQKLAVQHLFDSGMCPPCEIKDGSITFDLCAQPLLNVLLKNVSPGLKVFFQVTEEEGKFIISQGLLASKNGIDYYSVPLKQTEKDSVLVAQLDEGGDIWIATRLPYGRNSLDQLFCDTHNAANLRAYLLRRDHRIVPVFEFGKDDGIKPIHFLIAGECAWETSAQWVADAMIRTLCADVKLARKLLDRAVIRIIPHISPYSATQPNSSYTTLDGSKIYGASTWDWEVPPAEYALVRDEVVKVINKGRLGFMLTLHSWQAARKTSTMETIQSSGNNILTGKRLQWAKNTLEQLMKDVPKGSWSLPEKIWKAGLARDYLLQKYNAVTFRMEFTTRGQGLEDFQKTGRQLLENLSGIDNWGQVIPATH